MPIYEFYSPDTHKIYSFYARRLGMNRLVPRCPDGPDLRMQRRASRFAVVGKAREPQPGGDAGDSFDDPRMERAMEEMEREFAGLDDANPDPRQLGHLMRRMAELTGEPVPEAFDEMVGRLEKGEDPEKLEEEYGELMDDDSHWGGDGDEVADGAATTIRGRRRQQLRELLARTRPAAKDPKLYEMIDYVDARE